MTDDQTNDFDELSDDQLEAAAGGAGEWFGDSANDDDDTWKPGDSADGPW